MNDFLFNILPTDTACLRALTQQDYDENFWRSTTTRDCYSRKTLAYQNMPVYIVNLFDEQVLFGRPDTSPKPPPPAPTKLNVQVLNPLQTTTEFAVVDRQQTFRDFGETDFFRLVDDSTQHYELQYAEQEFNQIRTQLANRPVNCQMSSNLHRDELIKALTQPADILHLVTHSWRDPSSFANFYLLARPKPGTVLWDNLISEVEISDLPIQAKLVVLSSCESTSSGYSPGLGVRGLAAAFIRGGAEMVIGSRWRVDDRAAAELMKHFYAHLARDFDPSLPVERVRQALQYAVRQLVESDDYCHPFYWAGWQLFVR